MSSPSGNDGFDVKHFLFRYCNMQGKHENDDHQLWRLKVDNSLRVVSGFQTVSHMCRAQPDHTYPVVESPPEPTSQISRWPGACKNAYFMALEACGRSQRLELFQNYSYFQALGACEEFVISKL